jgi:hypothetical protein
MNQKNIIKIMINYLLSMGIYIFSFVLIIFLQVIFDFSLDYKIINFITLLIPSIFIAKKFGMQYVLITVVILSSINLLLWLMAVSHGHFFENIQGWLSETSYMMDYLPNRIKSLFIENGLSLIGAIIGGMYKKRVIRKAY